MTIDLSRLPAPIADAIRKELRIFPHLASDVVANVVDEVTHIVTVDDQGVAHLKWIAATPFEVTSRRYAKVAREQDSEAWALRKEITAAQTQLRGLKTKIASLKP